MGIFDFFSKNGKQELESLPQNDAERWIIGCYAIWSEYCGGSFKFIGGFKKNRSNASMARGVLSRDWVITNRESGIDMVKFLITVQNNSDDKECLAFQYGCACNITGRMYLGGYITRSEAMDLSKEIARKVQKEYHSWEEYCKAYIEGTKQESGIASDTEQFIKIYEELAALQDGPYCTDWNLLL